MVFGTIDCTLINCIHRIETHYNPNLQANWSTIIWLHKITDTVLRRKKSDPPIFQCVRPHLQLHPHLPSLLYEAVAAFQSGFLSSPLS